MVVAPKLVTGSGSGMGDVGTGSESCQPVPERRYNTVLPGGTTMIRLLPAAHGHAHPRRNRRTVAAVVDGHTKPAIRGTGGAHAAGPIPQIAPIARDLPRSHALGDGSRSPDPGVPPRRSALRTVLTRRAGACGGRRCVGLREDSRRRGSAFPVCPDSYKPPSTAEMLSPPALIRGGTRASFGKIDLLIQNSQHL